MNLRSALWLTWLPIACVEGGPQCAEREFLDAATGACLPWVPSDYPGPTGSEDPAYKGPWQVAEVQWACEGTGYTYAVRTDGWAASMALDIIGSGSWDGTSSTSSLPRETHVMENVEYDDYGAWDAYGLTLVSTGLAGEYTTGATTQFDCTVDGDTELTWKATMADQDGASMDCGIWGQDAADPWNTALGDDCFCFDCPT